MKCHVVKYAKLSCLLALLGAILATAKIASASDATCDAATCNGVNCRLGTHYYTNQSTITFVTRSTAPTTPYSGMYYNLDSYNNTLSQTSCEGATSPQTITNTYYGSGAGNNQQGRCISYVPVTGGSVSVSVTYSNLPEDQYHIHQQDDLGGVVGDLYSRCIINFTVDRTAPDATGYVCDGISPCNSTNRAQINSGKNVTFSMQNLTDNLSGIGSIKWIVDHYTTGWATACASGGTNVYTPDYTNAAGSKMNRCEITTTANSLTFSGLPVGNYTITAHVVDKAGNGQSMWSGGGAGFGYFMINTAPTITTSAKQTANNGATSTTLTNSYVRNGNKLYISGTITDPDAQNFTVSYSLSSNTTPGAWTVCRSASSTKTYSCAIDVSGDSTAAKYVHVKVNDGLQDSTSVYTTYKVDQALPNCGSFNTTAWQATSPQTMTMGTGTDATSGVASYSPTTRTCTVASNGGTCTVSVTDNAGNSRTCTSNAAKIDTTAPTCGSWSPSADVWTRTSQTFNMSGASDSLSGVVSSTGSCTATPTDANGTTCNVTITNGAGTSTTCTSPKAKKDSTAPTLSYSPAGSSTWLKAKPSTTVTVTDSQSGVATVRYAWSTSTADPAGISSSACTGGTAVTWAAGAISIPNTNATVNSQNYLHVCAIDNVGNITKSSAQYPIDTTIPTCTTWTPTSDTTCTDTGTSTFQLACADGGGSGLSTTPVTGSYVSAGNYSCTTGSANGATCTIQVKDNASNNSTTYTSPANCTAGASITLKKDSSSGTTLTGGGSSGWSNAASYAIYVSAADAAGISEIRYNFGTSSAMNAACTTGGAVVANNQAVSTATTGGTTLFVCARTPTGSTATTSFTVQLDRTAPGCGSWSPAANAYTASTASITHTLSGSTDAGGSAINTAGGSCTVTPTTAGVTCNVLINDNAGNYTTCISKRSTLDQTNPTGGVSVGSANPTYVNTQQTVTYTAADAASGISSWKLQRRGAPVTNGVCGSYGAWADVNTGSAAVTNATFTTSMTSGNCYQYQLVVTDKVNNSATFAAANTMVYDTVKPICGDGGDVTSTNWSPTSPLAWKTTCTAQTFTLSGNSDLASGLVSAIGTCNSAATHNATCNVTLTDRAGNTQTCTSPQNRCDTVNPVCGTNWTPASPVAWKTTAAEQNYTLTGSTDATSGIAATSYDCSAAATNGATCDITIADNSGRTTVCGPSPINRIDGVQPTIMFSPAGGTDWMTAGTVTANIQDVTSGLATAYYTWATSATVPSGIAACDAGTAVTLTNETLDITNIGALTPDQGTHYLHVCARDAAGNVQTGYAQYNYDNQAPVCNDETDNAVADNCWNPTLGAWHNDSRGETYTLATTCPTDPAGGSGLNTAWNSANNACTTGSSNDATCDVMIQDNAGNTATCTSPVNRYNGTAPVIDLTNASNNWFNTDRGSTITIKTQGGTGLAGARFAFAATSPFDAGCTSGGADMTMTGDPTSASGATFTTPAASAGGTRLWVCAVDNAGEVATNYGTFNVDKTAPTCDSWSPPQATWHNTVTGTAFTLSYTEVGGAGVKTVTSNPCTTDSVDGATCTVVVTDNANNAATCTSPANRIDTNRPVVEGSNSNNNWYNSDRNSVITAYAAGGVDLVEIRYSWGTALPADCKSGGTVIANGGTTTNAPTGGTTLHLCVRDAANNVGTNSGPFNVDKTAPDLDITGDDSNVWYNAERSATITRSDAGGSTIFQTRYNVGLNNLGADCSGGTLLATDSDTRLITITGGTTLYVCVKDNAGNITTDSGVFLIDKTAPTCPAFNSTNWTPYPVQWQQAGNTTVFYMQGATDAGGSDIDVSSGTCTTGNTNNSTCASGTGKIVINDNAGNTTACDSPANKIDGNAPTTPTITSAPASALGASYTNNTSVNVFISGSGDEVGGAAVNSGLLDLPYTYVLTGAEVSGGEATYSAAVVIDDEGVTTVTARAYDRVLNSSSPATNTVKIDRTLPIINVNLAGGQSAVATGSASGTGLLYQESPTIELSATDPVNSSNGSVGSGFAGMAYIWLEDTDPISNDMLTACGSALDESNGAFPGWEGHEFTTQIPGNGTHTLCAVAKDNAGNLSNVQALSYTLDTDAPSILLTLNQPAPSMVSGWYLSMPTFTAEAIDNNGSGVRNMKYLLIPTSEASGSAKYDANYDIINDTDSRIVTITPTSSEMMDFTRLIGAPPLAEGNYTLFVGAEDASTGIPHSPTRRETISVDLQKPISDLSYVETATSVVTPLTSDNANYALLQTESSIDSILMTDGVTVNTTNFDPLSSDLTQAPSNSGMTSGLKSCTLQYRSVAIRQDGSGLLETTSNGAINWGAWTTDGDYLTSDCAATKAFVPAHNTAYQLRLQATDNADRVADLKTSNVLVVNLDPVYRPGFADMDDNVPVSQIQNHIINLDCTEASGCTETRTLDATLDEDLAVNTYEVCLTINDTDIEKCQTVTSSTTAETHLSFTIAANEFPGDQDVFVGGKLTTTWTAGDALNNIASLVMATAEAEGITPASSNPSFAVDYNVIIFVERDYPPIVRPTRQNNFIFMRNGKLN